MLVREDRVAFVVVPTHDTDEISDKARDATLENDIISPDDILLVDMSVIILGDSCIMGEVTK